MICIIFMINPEDVGYVNYQMNSEGVLEIIPINNYNGTINFTITIDDEQKIPISQSEIHNSIKTFDVIVERVNDIPIAIITKGPDNPNWFMRLEMIKLWY